MSSFEYVTLMMVSAACCIAGITFTDYFFVRGVVNESDKTRVRKSRPRTKLSKETQTSLVDSQSTQTHGSQITQTHGTQSTQTHDAQSTQTHDAQSTQTHDAQGTQTLTN